MLAKIEQLLQEIEGLQAANAEELEALRIKYLSKKGAINELMADFRNVPAEQKKEVGMKLNELKNKAQERIASLKEAFETQDNSAAEMDLTRTAYPIELGTRHPLSIVKNEIIDIFHRLGFSIADGPEIEDDLHVFTAMNFAEDHPARDMQDSLYINENVLVRTQTSPVQVRTLLEAAGKPVKIVCPGKVYRRDDDDATHSHQFMQFEGLVVDKNITMSDLKGTLSLLMKKMFGENRSIRFKPSYFPFTEPSVEVDVSCFKCGGKGCPMCKHTGWIEVLGAGMVHPNVLKGAGYDPEVYRGFAFGVGIERVTMLRHNIDDIRNFYTNDYRFLKQFEGER